MMISTKANIAFLAMPRAASTSVEQVLLPFADIAFKGFPRFKHINLSIYNMRLRPFLTANGFENLETTALFREPVSWLQSWYRYRSDPKIKLKRNSTAGLSFNEFVSAYLMESVPDFAKVGQQSKFVAGKDTACGVTHLYKFENITGFETFLSARFLEEFRFGQSNKSAEMPTALSPELLKELQNRFSTDFDLHDSAL